MAILTHLVHKRQVEGVWENFSSEAKQSHLTVTILHVAEEGFSPGLCHNLQIVNQFTSYISRPTIKGLSIIAEADYRDMLSFLLF